MTLYLHAKNYEDFIVTHYKQDEIHEFVMKWTQRLGPIELESDEGTDIVFGLPEIEGIFVASKQHSQILDM
jgi:hypothetical protein